MCCASPPDNVRKVVMDQRGRIRKQAVRVEAKQTTHANQTLDSISEESISCLNYLYTESTMLQKESQVMTTCAT
jgi:hypothetical protein